MCKVIAEINKLATAVNINGERKEKLWTLVVCLPRGSIGLDLSSGLVEWRERGREGGTTQARQSDRQEARLIDNIDTDAHNCNADYIMIYGNWQLARAT